MYAWRICMNEDIVKAMREEIENSIAQYKVDKDLINNTFGLVAYTDGGYRAKMHYRHADPACGGCGVFGYIYANQEPKTGHGCVGFIPTHVGLHYKDQMNKPIVTKLGVEKIPQAVTPLVYVNVRDGSEDFKTNNIGELMGVVHALRIAKAFDEIRHVFIRGDSEYVLNGLSKSCENWSQNGWKLGSGDPVKNVEIWQELYGLYLELQSMGKVVELSWVKGHSDSIGNQKVDSYATEGMIAAINKADLPSYRLVAPRDMWAPKVDTPYLLSEPLLFVSNSKTTNTVKINDVEHHFYYQGNFGKEADEYTKVGSDKSYAITALYNKEPVIQSVVELCRDIKSYNGLTSYIGRMDEFFRPKNYLEMKDVGLIFLRRNWKNQFTLSEGKLVLEELNPIRHGERLSTVFNFLEEVLYTHIAGTLNEKYIIHDITDDFFEVKETKKGVKLSTKEDIDKSIDINLGVTENLTLTIGIDTPKLRIIKQYASTNTKIKLIYWYQADKSIRYATIMETIDGVGIWGSVYSNNLTIT